MSSLIPLIIVWATALAVSLAVTGFVALGGLGDVPDGRSSHTRLTPTAGGLGILAGLGAGLFSVPGTDPAIATVAVLALALGLIGLQDDAFTLRARIKMLLILAAAAVATRALGPVTALPLWGTETLTLPLPIAYVGTILWIVVVTNAVNFMDGINGLLAGTANAAAIALFVLYGVAGASSAAWISLALSGALVGFLPYNFRIRARVFSGDTGALAVGFVLALLPLVALREASPRMIYIVPILLLPLLADVFMTLARRLRRGENLAHAHAGHLYQLAARRWGHLAVSMSFVVATLVMACIATLALGQGWIGSLPALLGLAVLMGALAMWPARRLERQERRSTT